ncbi:matrilin-3, partial [Elysia marginata]
FSCECAQGYQPHHIDKTSCVEVTRCEQQNGGCAQTCLTRETGEIYCQCRPGYTLNPDGKNCDGQSRPVILRVRTTGGVLDPTSVCVQWATRAVQTAGPGAGHRALTVESVRDTTPVAVPLAGPGAPAGLLRAVRDASTGAGVCGQMCVSVRPGFSGPDVSGGNQCVTHHAPMVAGVSGSTGADARTVILVHFAKKVIDNFTVFWELIDDEQNS